MALQAARARIAALAPKRARTSCSLPPSDAETLRRIVASIPSPSEIKAGLDEYVVGQPSAKRLLAGKFRFPEFVSLSCFFPWFHFSFVWAEDVA